RRKINLQQLILLNHHFGFQFELGSVFFTLQRILKSKIFRIIAFSNQPNVLLHHNHNHGADKGSKQDESHNDAFSPIHVCTTLLHYLFHSITSADYLAEEAGPINLTFTRSIRSPSW